MTDDVEWGTSTPDDWRTWLEDRWVGQTDAWVERARVNAGLLGQLADAYAHGWVAGLDPQGSAQQSYLDAAYAFGHEYERAAWLYAAQKVGSREGYAVAWLKHLRARGLL